MIVLLFCAVAHYDQETPQNTNTISGTIQDVEHHSSHKGPSYVTFCVNSEQYFYWFDDNSGNSTGKVLKKLMQASEVSDEVTLVLSNDIHIRPFTWGRIEVVEISTETDMIASVDVHNRYQKIHLVIRLVLIGVLITILSVYTFLTIESEKLIKRRKRANK